jgi:hypothetical protein
MKILLLLLALVASPTWAQAQLMPKTKSATARADLCAPIGKTAKVYSMKCDSLPAPPGPAPQAEFKEAAPPPQPEVRKSGLFGWSYDRGKPDE